MGVGLYLQKLTSLVQQALGEGTVPGPNRHVGDAVILSGQVAALREPLVQHIELALGLHGKTVDCIGDFGWRVSVKMTKAAAKIGRTAHLPEQPGQAFGTPSLAGQEGAKFFRQIQQDRAGLEHPDWLGSAVVHQHGNF